QSMADVVRHEPDDLLPGLAILVILPAEVRAVLQRIAVLDRHLRLLYRVEPRLVDDQGNVVGRRNVAVEHRGLRKTIFLKPLTCDDACPAPGFT
ncbi:MAG TPA: hypothetical protein VKE74_30510, partial [Gemmataceae bacterium]|nr:hypothetical protein [Gemmataceae bacterium]